MTLSSLSLFGPGNAFKTKASVGFSLVEIIVVSAMIGLLLALTVPGLIALTPLRKSGIHEVSGFLENARSRAISSQSEMVVAFADGAFPGEGAHRQYALFALEGESEDLPGDRPLKQLSSWRLLPQGVVFGDSGHFEVTGDTTFRTLFDLSARRRFPLPPTNPGGEGGTAALPYLHFGTDGGIRFPPFSDADALHLGLVEGVYSQARRTVELTAARPGINGTGTYAIGECLEIGFYTGRARILTD
jgi:hypothetical protein